LHRPGFTHQREREVEILDRAFGANRSVHQSLERQGRVRAGQHRQGQRLRLQRYVIRREHLTERRPPSAGDARRLARSISVIDVGAREADVEPDRIEHRGPGDCAANERKLWIQILDRAKVE
jgi:hypothetical protein